MEEQPHLFELQLDPVSQASLAETAKWGKFLSIVGFISIGLIVVMGFSFGTIMSLVGNSLPGYQAVPFMGIIMGIYCLVIAGIYFVPVLFLYKFSVQMKTALQGSDQDQLAKAFASQKTLYKFIGIVTIVGLAAMVLMVISVIVGMAFTAGR